MLYELTPKVEIGDINFFDLFNYNIALIIYDRNHIPIKFSTNQKELMWSTRLESVRKDVECTFGVLTARFRILQSRIKFQHQSKVDNVFVASCVLHNMNLVHDEFDVNWKDPVNWETPDNEDDQDLREAREL